MTQIKLKQAHTHASIKYPVDAVIDVSDVDANWIEENGIGTVICPIAMSTQVEQKSTAKSK